MRRESSTVVVLVGQADDGLLAELARSPNVAIARGPAPAPAEASSAQAVRPQAGAPGTTTPSAPLAAPASAQAGPGWEPGALAMREAARRRSTYVIVRDDPLAEVAARWSAMWDLSAGAAGAAAAAGFEESAADALAAWRGKRFDLPDYYLVMAPAQLSAAIPDIYLGPLKAARPHRVAVAGVTGSPDQAVLLLDALRSLEHGPWWPPLDELLDVARGFYAGGLTTSSPGTS